MRGKHQAHPDFLPVINLNQCVPADQRNAADRTFLEKLWGVAEGAIGAEPGLDAVQYFKNWNRAKSKRFGSSARIPSPRCRIVNV
jgi:hypothetical protein